MLSDDTVFEFLTQPQKLSVALEIANYVERLKRSLHPIFWKNFNLNIKRRLVDSELSSRWKYLITLCAKAHRDGWVYNEFRPILPDDFNFPFLFMSFGQGPSETNFRLRWGVKWTKAPAYFMHPALTTLSSKLISLGMEEVHENINIIMWGFYDQEIYSPEFLTEMYNRPDEWVDKIVGDIWQSFLDIVPLMETINKAVANS